MLPSFCASRSYGGPEGKDLGIALKISGAQYELNVFFQFAEITALESVPNASWHHGALNIGSCAGHRVWWSCDDSVVSVLVGRDDQTWDFGIDIPLAEFPNLRAALATELTPGLAD